MKICPKCQKSTREVDVIVKDPATTKHWLVTKCGKCGFNYDLEEYTTGGPSGQQIMDKYPENKMKPPGWRY